MTSANKEFVFKFAKTLDHFLEVLGSFFVDQCQNCRFKCTLIQCLPRGVNTFYRYFCCLGGLRLLPQDKLVCLSVCSSLFTVASVFPNMLNFIKLME